MKCLTFSQNKNSKGKKNNLTNRKPYRALYIEVQIMQQPTNNCMTEQMKVITNRMRDGPAGDRTRVKIPPSRL